MKEQQTEDINRRIKLSRVQFFSLHDGPGIRTTVFLQGCNLRCRWCHNPETWGKDFSVSYDDKRCIRCQACAEACRKHVHMFLGEKHCLDLKKCTQCGDCVKVCPSGALEMNGYYEDIEQLCFQLMRDMRLYEISGGGVTFSGGEPFLQYEPLAEICKRLKKAGIHIAVETALCVPWKIIEPFEDLISLFLVDMKLFDREKHKVYTGTDNTVILENIQRLVKACDVAVRIPVIGNVNDDLKNAEKTADFLAGLRPKILSAELLPYHDFGIKKAEHIGIAQERFEEPEEERIHELEAVYRSRDIKVI